MRPDDQTIVNCVNELGLPSEIAALYAAASPISGSTVPWVVEELAVFSVVELPDALEGYRWTGPERTGIPGWSVQWVVVAQALGDPFFLDLGTAGPSVCFARHGAGAWHPMEVAPSLTTFLEVLARLGLSDLRCN